jgi:glycosyltransferase involved in cell wall biosynthesis
MNLACSIIICSHNPRPHYLAEVLRALRAQTLPLDKWELLLIDNASQPGLDASIDLAWHPHGRLIREETLGVSHARLHGIREARAELLVFVDDDNLLAPDYLQQAIEIGLRLPFLGAWGGQIIPKFEVEPEEWMREHLSTLALYESNRDVWSNVGDSLCRPFGAGMCLRRSVAQAYAQLAGHPQSLRRKFGRVGQTLTSCEDTDIALTAIDLEMGVGRFQALQLHHIISRNRLEESYLVRLAEGIALSHRVLSSLRTFPSNRWLPSSRGWRKRLGQWLGNPNCARRDFRFFMAKRRGTLQAKALLEKDGGH